MNKRLKQVARTGYIAKGGVYALTGILALFASFGMGGSAEGKLGVLEFLQKQPFGNVLLIALSFGLLCYGFWRFIQSVQDPEDIGTNFKGIGKRIGFFLSGFFYTVLAVIAILKIFNALGSSGNKGKKMIPYEYLPYILYAIAFGLAIKAVFHLVKAYKGNFLKEFRLDKLANPKKRKTVKWIGYAGLVSRGIVVGLVSYFFFEAAHDFSVDEVKGTAEAFTFLRQNSEGPWLVGLVAFGLICYGIYVCIMARYRQFYD